MQIKIEIDVKPEELRRFLGLPDVAGLQEDLIQFVREKLGAATDSFDPASFVKENLQSLRDSSAWRKLVSAAKATTTTATTVVVPETLKKVVARPAGVARKRGAPRKTKPAGRKAVTKKAEGETL